MSLEREPSPARAGGGAFGAVRLFAAAILISLNAWLTQGEFLPLGLDEQGIDYIMVSASLGTLLWNLAGAVTALLIWQALAVWRRSPPDLRRFLTRENTRHLNALFLLAFSLLPLLTLAGQPLRIAAPWLYILFDLRWWWWPLVLLAVVRTTRPKFGRDALPFLTMGSTRAWQWSLAGAAVIVAALSTPHYRFSPNLSGDEPKYLRYCETFYQGVGFDISKLQPISRLPEDLRPRLSQNVADALAAVPEEWANLGRDAGALWQGQRDFNKSKYLGRWFFEGKRPGSVYQVHTPGLGMILFPAYYLDRRVFSPGWAADGQFPAKLDLTQSALLGLFAVFAIVVFRMLREHVEHPRLAWLLALLAVTSLPVGAFAFQVYPEVAAGLILVAAFRFLMAVPRHGAWSGLVHGLLAGFLVWLHVRFGLAVLVLLVWSLFGWRRGRAAVVAFAGGLLAAAGSFSLYAYRLTGSLLPTAMYDSRGNYFSMTETARGMLTLVLDHSWGLFSHAPIYLLALVGVGLTARRRPAAAGLAAVLFVALAASAGHDPSAGGTTPVRYLVAGAPLLMLFVGDAAVRFRGSRTFVAAAVVLALVSLETGVAYNLNHSREAHALLVNGFSGWRPNQLFPILTVSNLLDQPSSIALAAVWGLVAAALVGFGIRAAPTGVGAIGEAGVPGGLVRASVSTRFVLVGVGMIAIAGTAVGAFTGDWQRARFLSTPDDTRMRVLSLHLERGRCALCATSRLGEVNPGPLLGREAAQLTLDVPATVEPGQGFDVVVRAVGPRNEAGWGSVRLDFADGSIAPPRNMLGERRLTHAYAAAGTYRVNAWLDTSLNSLAISETVEVTPYPPDKDRPWPRGTWVGENRKAAAALLVLALSCAALLRTVVRQRRALRRLRSPGVSAEQP